MALIENRRRIFQSRTSVQNYHWTNASISTISPTTKTGTPQQIPQSNNFNFIPIRVNKVKYYKSFLPATVRSWNNLDDNMKQLPIPGHFKNALKNSLFPKHVKYFSHCKGAAAVNHTRMRLGLI